jgi:hypothetical protein
MTDPVTLHDAYYLINTGAWLRQRTGALNTERSSSLQTFTGCDAFNDYQPTMDIEGRMRLWCAANQLTVGAVIYHDSQTLTKDVTIVLATTSDPQRDALALVSVEGRAPEVYADITTDEGYWYDHTRIEIVCRGGLSWTWDGGPFVATANGEEQRVTTAFGLGAPVITRCRDCAADDDATIETMCPCSGAAIYCPHCGQRAQVRLPQVPSFEDLQR